jgi:hypothetical protein
MEKKELGRLDNQKVKDKLPANYEELKKTVNRTSSWRERLDAVEELGKWKSQKTIDVLMNRMINDPVYKVQEASFRKLKEFGEDVQLPPRKKGDLMKGTNKILLRIKKSLPADHTFEEFREKLKKMRLDVYDTYEGDKGFDFEKWLENTWTSLSYK